MEGYIATPHHPLQIACKERFGLRYSEVAALAGLVAAARTGVGWLTAEELGAAVARQAELASDSVGGTLAVLKRARLVESRGSGKGPIKEWRATDRGIAKMRGVGERRAA